MPGRSFLFDIKCENIKSYSQDQRTDMKPARGII